ncbi:alpha/beta fold hydrolase [Fluviibacterium sp. S390]|uniref:alpha/beta fold hydrolase n=1 Tax=Fluviibacterium sp. S390 TaxID=3415139 RepID=UPI003C79E2BB
MLELATAAALTGGAVLGVDRLATRAESQAEAEFPPEGRILTIDGVKVHAWVQGSGPDLVLLHGAGGNLRDFTFALAPRLARDFRVIAFDRPGHGFTGRVPEAAEAKRGESPREQARLLQAAARQLGVTRALVLGQSFGGAVAMAWALEDPAMTAGLVIVSGATMPWPGKLKPSYHVNASRAGATTLVPLLTAFPPQSLMDQILSGIFAPAPVPQGFTAHFGLPLSLRRTTMVANARQVTGLKDHVTAMSGHYGTLQMPAELIHGALDTIVLPDIHAAPLSTLLPDARLTMLDDAGHMPHHTHPEAVLDAVARIAERAGLR